MQSYLTQILHELPQDVHEHPRDERQAHELAHVAQQVGSLAEASPVTVYEPNDSLIEAKQLIQPKAEVLAQQPKKETALRLPLPAIIVGKVSRVRQHIRYRRDVGQVAHVCFHITWHRESCCAVLTRENRANTV